MKSRNKVLSVLLALCMLLSLLPAAAFAEELPAEEPAVETSAVEDETPAAVQSGDGSGIAVQTSTKTRTEALDLSDQTTDLSNTAEGWSWNAATMTLTLNGATFDVHEDDALAAIYLPDGATVTTENGSKNTVINGSLFYGVPEGWKSFVGSSIMSDGALTIAGEGDLSVTGGSCGIFTKGKLAIKAPISVNCTRSTESGYIYALMVHGVGDNVVPTDMISIDPSLRIKTPANGKIVAEAISDDFGGDTTVTKALVFVVDGSGKAARDLVIEKTSSSGGSSSGDSYNGTQSTVTSDLTSVTRVTVDGKTVSPKNYTVSGGNITFTDAFLKTLSNGLHKVTIENDKHIARGTFNVNNPAGTGAANSPKTADAGVALYAAMAAASLLGSGVVFTRKRREF